jgi:hypothetical protein
MLEEIKNNPVMLIAGLLAVVNIVFGDPTLTTAIIESLAILGGGLIARAKVTPVRKVQVQ